MVVSETVVPQDYPELALLVWNRDTSRPIPAADALAIYESNWRHVDVARLTADESALIDRLRVEHGKGVLLATS